MASEGRQFGVGIGRAVVNKLGAEWSPEKRKFFDAWAKAEGTVAQFNPFATTRRGYPGETNFNSVGVKHYTTWQQGMQATYDTLLNGHYDGLVNLLRRSDVTAEQLATAVAQSPWGTGTGVLRVLGATTADVLQSASDVAQNKGQKTLLTAEQAKIAAAPPAPSGPSMGQLIAGLAPSASYLERMSGFGPLSSRMAAMSERFGEMNTDDFETPIIQPARDEGPVYTPEDTAADAAAPRHGGFNPKSPTLQLPTSWGATHVTSGLGWGTRSAKDIIRPAGTLVNAPEAGEVVYFHPTGAQGGGSMLIRTPSGREYWLGHIDNGLPPGTTFKKGQTLAVVSADHKVPHVHIDRRDRKKKKGGKG